MLFCPVAQLNNFLFLREYPSGDGAILIKWLRRVRLPSLAFAVIAQWQRNAPVMRRLWVQVPLAARGGRSYHLFITTQKGIKDRANSFSRPELNITAELLRT